jgi:hypothetical protein
MFYARRHLNLTLALDLTAFVSGGNTNGNKVANAIYVPELWDPATKAFTKLASMRVPRVYHSLALLLLDGRILHVGSNPTDADDEFRAEIFSPPYLFKGSRAEITSMPTSGQYAQKIIVTTPKSDRIGRVTLVRTGSVTHSINMDQRGDQLPFSRKSATELEVTLPANANVCPPGPYILFLLTHKGVPSNGRVIKIS